MAYSCAGHSLCLAHFLSSTRRLSQINKIVSSDRIGDKPLKQVCLHRVDVIRAPFSMVIHALLSLIFRFYDFKPDSIDLPVTLDSTAT